MSVDHCWWTREFPRAHVAKFYDRLPLIRSFLRASKVTVLKLIEIVILWVNCTIPFGLSLLRNFWGITFKLFYYFVWLRITDEDSVPEMRIWSILLIESLFLYLYLLCSIGKCMKYGLSASRITKFTRGPSVASYLHEKQTSRIQSLNKG